MSRLRRRAVRDERGAALVEFAVTMSLVILLLMGVFEFGPAADNKLKVETAVRAGARVGSSLGADRMADYNLLQGVKSVLTELGAGNVQYVVVFKANGTSGAIPSGCSGSSPTSQTNQCNVYTGAQISSLTSTDFSGTTSCGSTAPDRFWCPTTRQAVQHIGPDNLGVWIRASSNTLTNYFGSPLSMESTAVMRLEPKG